MHYSYQGDLVMTTIVIVEVIILVYSSYGYYSHSYEFSILKELLLFKFSILNELLLFKLSVLNEQHLVDFELFFSL